MKNNNEFDVIRNITEATLGSGLDPSQFTMTTKPFVPSGQLWDIPGKKKASPSQTAATPRSAVDPRSGAPEYFKRPATATASRTVQNMVAAGPQSQLNFSPGYSSLNTAPPLAQPTSARISAVAGTKGMEVPLTTNPTQLSSFRPVDTGGWDGPGRLGSQSPAVNATQVSPVNIKSVKGPVTTAYDLMGRLPNQAKAPTTVFDPGGWNGPGRLGGEGTLPPRSQLSTTTAVARRGINDPAWNGPGRLGSQAQTTGMRVWNSRTFNVNTSSMPNVFAQTPTAASTSTSPTTVRPASTPTTTNPMSVARTAASQADDALYTMKDVGRDVGRGIGKGLKWAGTGLVKGGLGLAGGIATETAIDNIADYMGVSDETKNSFAYQTGKGIAGFGGGGAAMAIPTALATGSLVPLAAAAGSGAALAGTAVAGYQTGKYVGQGIGAGIDWALNKAGLQSDEQRRINQDIRAATSDKGFLDIAADAAGYIGDVSGINSIINSGESARQADQERAIERQRATQEQGQRYRDEAAEASRRLQFVKSDQYRKDDPAAYEAWQKSQGVSGLKASEVEQLEKEAKEQGIAKVLELYGKKSDPKTGERIADPQIQAWAEAWKKRNPELARKDSTNPMDVYQNQVQSGQIDPMQGYEQRGQALFSQQQAKPASTSTTPAPASQTSAAPTTAGGPRIEDGVVTFDQSVGTGNAVKSQQVQPIAPDAAKASQTVLQTVNSIVNPDVNQRTSIIPGNQSEINQQLQQPQTMTGSAASYSADGVPVQPNTRRGSIQMVRENYYNILSQRLNEELGVKRDAYASGSTRKKTVRKEEGKYKAAVQSFEEPMNRWSGDDSSPSLKGLSGRRSRAIGTRELSGSDIRDAVATIMSAAQDHPDFKKTFGKEDVMNPGSESHRALLSRYPKEHPIHAASAAITAAGNR